jgi:hypothetical protein
MSTFQRSNGYARAFVAALVSGGFLWALVLSASPQLHQRVHQDSNRAEHHCAATMIASGSYDHAAHAPLVSAPVPAIHFSTIAFSWRMHFRACAARASLGTQLSRVLAER